MNISRISARVSGRFLRLTKRFYRFLIRWIRSKVCTHFFFFFQLSVSWNRLLFLPLVLGGIDYVCAFITASFFSDSVTKNVIYLTNLCLENRALSCFVFLATNNCFPVTPFGISGKLYCYVNRKKVRYESFTPHYFRVLINSEKHKSYIRL